jgi:hypothetical protein
MLPLPLVGVRVLPLIGVRSWEELDGVRPLPLVAGDEVLRAKIKKHLQKKKNNE